MRGSEVISGPSYENYFDVEAMGDTYSEVSDVSTHLSAASDTDSDHSVSYGSPQSSSGSSGDDSTSLDIFLGRSTSFNVLLNAAYQSNDQGPQEPRTSSDIGFQKLKGTKSELGPVFSLDLDAKKTEDTPASSSRDANQSTAEAWPLEDGARRHIYKRPTND